MSYKKKVFITGGAKRIGKSIALFLSKQGFDVVFHYHSSQKEADFLINDIRQQGGHAEAYQANFSDVQEADKVLNQIFSEHKDIDLVINSASKFEPSSFREVSLERIEDFFAVNLISPVRVCQHAIQSGVTHIINITDGFTAHHHPDYATYLLTKKGLNDFTKIAAKEFAPHVRVNAIAPGPTLPTVNNDETYETERLKELPLQRRSSLKDILNALDFLIHSESITGEILYIDGGAHL